MKLVRSTPFGLPYARVSTAAAVETLRVLALRVEFQPALAGDSVSTSGLFDRRTRQQFLAQEGHLVDPAPHTLKYFESHLAALDRYYQAVSNGKVKIIGDVWPKVDSASYRLPVRQAYYGSKGPYADSGVIVEISHFFRDAIRLADSSSPEINFSAYQSVCIFYAGSDRQDDILGNTPNDFFTGFLRLGDSVLVDSGRKAITEGLVVPESPSQDNRIVGLNATLAHEFGHQLGLIDIYNTVNKITQVGDFSLMDNNAADVAAQLDFTSVGGQVVLASGLLPVYPDAWSRAFLGFLDTLAVTRGPVNLALLAAELQRSATEAVKIPISEQEYFLVENRAVDFDSYPGSALKVDSVTGVVLGPARPEGDSSVFTNEYDALLPGSGLLIWHVDEGVAGEIGCYDNLGNPFTKFECNTVNTDPQRRFLELKEADGIVDFGGDYYTGEFGSAEDMFWAPKNTAFTPASNPSSRNSFGGQTGISVTGIGPPDTLMSFSIASDYLLPGWPQYTAAFSPKESPVVGDLKGDGTEEVLGISGPFLLAWNPDGSKFIPSGFERKRLALNGDTLTFPFAVFGVDTNAFTNPNAIFRSGPMGADVNNDGKKEVFAGSATGALWGFAPVDKNNDSLADLLPGFPKYLKRGGLTCLLVGKIGSFSNPLIFAGTSLGEGYLVDGTGVVRDSNQLEGPVIGAALDTSGNLYITTDRNDSVFVYRGLHPSAGWPKGFAADTISAPVLAQGDSGLWLAFTTGGGKLYLLDANGNLASGFPISLGTATLPQPIWTHSPAGEPVLLLAYDNKIVAYQTDGLLVADFPKSVDAQRPSGGSVPILANLQLRETGTDMLCVLPTGNLYFPRTLEREAAFYLGTGAGVAAFPAVTRSGRIFVRDTSGFVYGYNVPGFGLDSLAWRQKNHDFAGTNFLPKGSVSLPAGGALVADQSFYNYPNPVTGGRTALRYRLTAPARATLSVYDMAGNRIREPVAVPAEVGNDNEVPLDCSGLAAGVYLCRLEVSSPAKKEVVFCKVAVVK